MHLRIILIGLSSLLTACGIFSIDPPNDKHEINFENGADENISVVFETDSLTRSQFEVDEDSVILSPLSIYTLTKFVGEETEIETIEEAVDYQSIYTIKLYTSDSLIKVWEGTPDYYGDSIHSPFNYDSWEIRPVDENPENVVGAVTFTIKEEDLK